MSEVLARPRSRFAAAALLLVALGAALGYAAVPGGRPRELVGESLIVGTNLLAGAVFFAGRDAAGAWRSARHIAAASLLLSISAGAMLAVYLQRATPRAGLLDALFLLFLVPILGASREEYRGHFHRNDRRGLAIDAMLIGASLAAICYVLVRPTGADGTALLSTATFSIIAATLCSASGVLALWAPSRAHLAQWIVLSAIAAATVVFGADWTRGTFDGATPWVKIVFITAMPILASMSLWIRPGSRSGPGVRPVRLARPILTSISVFAACTALATVATLDRGRGLSTPESTAIIAVLGIGVAARILANQILSTQASEHTRRALEAKEQALAEADAALDRVRDANETLAESDEHLRRVFEAAVDGIVELDQQAVILRVNDAFCRMVRIDRDVIEGLPWSALAASVSGADGSFASLPVTGQGTIERPEGQPLYLESRISDVPMTPPRRLLLVRDVTAGRIADQTIRSLFQFLQDRDEDRTRLLRRTNSAIEAERNRIARDLHDGPVQGVSAASLSLEAALLMIRAGEIDRGIEVLTKIRKELAEEADALRGLMSGLRPPLLEERGLMPALRETIVRFGTEQGVRTEFSGTIGAEVADDLETLAYRVVQEALSNAAKHANAEHVSVTVDSDQTQLRIEIEDDGVGFDSGHVREFLRMGRVGLASMRERVELAGGTFVVRSTPQRGTSIVATLPLATIPAGREIPVSDRS